MVMGGDSCSEGCGFESKHRILVGHFSQLLVVKIVSCFKRQLSSYNLRSNNFN